MGKLTQTPEVLAQLAERFRVLAATAVRGRALPPHSRSRDVGLLSSNPSHRIRRTLIDSNGG